MKNYYCHFDQFLIFFHALTLKKKKKVYALTFEKKKDFIRFI